MNKKWLASLIAAVEIAVVVAVSPAAYATSGLLPQYTRVLTNGVTYSSYVDNGPRNIVDVTKIAAGSAARIRAIQAPATAQGTTLATVTSMCRRALAVACVNGDFFGRTGVPAGGVLIGGRWVRPQTGSQQQVWVDSHNRFSIGAQPANVVASLGATKAPILLPGQPISIGEHDYFADGAFARTLVGWNAAGDRFLVTVEKGVGSRGMSLAQAANLMRRLGATTAVNEDGGGSAQMVVNGLLRSSAGPRVVSNMWAVFA